jgi:HSP20 family protein
MAESKTDDPRTEKQTQALERNPATRGRERAGLRRWEGPGWFAGPFGFMDRMAEEMDRTFDRLFRDFGGAGSRTREGIWAPRVEAFQKGDQYLVRAELPGLKKEDINVDVTDDAITIQGERRSEHEEEREGYRHSEVSYGQFYRTIPLPEGAIAESAKASFKDGLLQVTVQAPPEASRGRRIEITEGSDETKSK